MADLIQNVQEVYKKWESRSNPNRGRMKNRVSFRKQYREPDLSSFSRSLQQRRKESFKRVPYSNLHKYDNIAEFKMAPSVVPLSKPRPFVGIPCAKCFPHSRAFIEDETVYLLGVNNLLHIPYFSIQSLNICCLWNLFKIRALPQDTPVDILKNKRIENIVQEIFDVDDQEECKSDGDAIDRIHENIRNITRHLKSSVSSFCLEFTSFFLHHVFKKVFDGIFINKGQLEILKILHKEDIPFVYLPLYRSYFDYILVPYILHMNSLPIPFSFVVDELFFPVLGHIFRILGAVFLKKSVISEESRDDFLYDAVVKSCIIKCLQASHSIELFLEAHPSFTGKPQMPNTNLFSAIVNAVADGIVKSYGGIKSYGCVNLTKNKKGSVEDIYVVPVSIIYETTERSFIAKQLQSNFKEESSIFSKLFYMWKIIHLKYGNVRMNFNQPFSVKEFLETYRKESALNFNCSLSPISDLSSKEQKDKHNYGIRAAVKGLSLHAFYDATTSSSVMGTHLLAFLLVTQYRKGGTQQQLQNSMDWLRGEIQKKKCDMGFSGESLPVIKRAVELLGKDLISIETIEMEWTSSDLENNNVKVKIYRPIVKLPHVLELQYYANAVVPIFLKESIIGDISNIYEKFILIIETPHCFTPLVFYKYLLPTKGCYIATSCLSVNALYALIDVDICHFHHCDSRFYVSRDGLVQTAMKLSEFLKYEFITVLPCQDITTAFNDTIDVLIEKECLSGANVSEGFLKPGKKSRALAFDASSDEDQCNEVTEQQLKIDLREESISHLEFLRNILSPYIESYWLAACSLLKLIDEIKEESIFIQEMQTTAKEKLYKGLLAYEESFSAETLKNSLRMFADRRIIEYDYEDNITTLCLSESYNSFECINDIIADIEDFRK